MNQEKQDNLNKQLIEATEKGDLELIKYLVEQGADIHAKNDCALRLASYSGNIEIVKYLVEQGAEIHAKNNNALRWASENNHLNVVKYFLFDCQMEIKQETKDWLLKNNQHQILELIEKRDLLFKLNQEIIPNDSFDNLGKKVKI